MIDDVKYTEAIQKDNDYTLSLVSKGESSYDGVRFSARITRTFNFLAQQVTTLTRDLTYQPAKYQYGASSGISTTATIQRFDDFQSDAEIRLMHQKLTELGGHPPALGEIFPGLGKKSLRQP